MEVLAAIGLAGNIIQFIDFGRKLISKTAEIQKSGTGVLAENISIETASNDLALLSAELRDSASSAGDTALWELCQSCDTVATELLAVLDSVKVHGGQNKWKSFRKALRSVLSKEDVALLEQRLARFRDELNLRVAVDLRSVAKTAVTGSADNVNDRERVIQANKEQSSRLNDLDLNTKNLVDAIVRQKDVFEKAHTILQRQHLEKLVVAGAASFNSYDRRKDFDCIQNTRVGLLHEIREWADGNDKRPIFWLKGLAGTGKSTIARTIAHYYHDRRRLAASFFFSRDIGGDVRDARKFFTTIAAQLACASDPLGYHICNAINQKSDIVNQAPREQWRQLILEPLLKLQCSAPRLSLVLVVDALDECENEDDIRTIVNLLSEARLLTTARLRILITSRPEIPIRQGFDEISGAEHHDFVLHDISRSIVDHDIRVFVKYHLEAIRDKRMFDLEWPGEETVGALVKHASGLFIWAATACRFIKDGGRFTEKRLSAILGGDVSTTAPEKCLDMIYLKVLQSSIHVDFDEQETNEHCSILKKALGAIVTLFASLSINSLAKLVNITAKDIDENLGDLHAILDIRKDRHLPIRLHHPSFRDFLLNRKRCDDLHFWINESITHELMANNCIDLLSAELRRDICGLHEPGAVAADVSDQKMENILSTALQYACQYWVQHLKRSDAQPEDNGKTHNFLRQHLLHWFEVLSLLGKISEAVFAIQVLEDMIDVSYVKRRLHYTNYVVKAKNSPNLHAFIHDSKRFILYNRSIIEEAPLQTYCCALAFAPQRSLVRKQFKGEMLNRIKRSPQIVEEWSALVQALEGHTSRVNAVAFSPDGKQVVSASHDKTVRVWDAATGAAIQTLEGHTGRIMAVAFLPNSKQIVSASGNMTIRVWDAAIGAAIQTFKCHTGDVNAATFSPDGKQVVSASHNKTIQVWDAATGAAIQTLEGHTDWIRAVAFSPDSKQVASASDDNTVRVWDAATGTTIQTLRGHISGVEAVAFSPDGKQVVSASNDKNVWVWDAATGTAIQMLKNYTGWVSSVAFSSDGKKVVLATDNAAQVWDAATGTVIQTLEGHTDWIRAVAFSPDGKQVASASYDKTIRVWDVTTGTSIQAFQTLKGHAGRVNSVAFSPDSKQVVSASNDKTIRVWDAATGTVIQTLESHTGWVNSAAFSSDGKKVVLATDNAAQVWDAATGTAIQTLEGHTDWIRAVAFSPDGKQVASASYDKTIRVWDAATGTAIQTLEGHTDRIRAAAFSSDGKQVASASNDKTIRVWDATTGAAIQIFKNCSAFTLTFSKDGLYLYTDQDSYTIDSNLQATKQNHYSTIFLKDNWISFGNTKLLWLPPEYRPTCLAFQDNLVVLGLFSGGVKIIEFNIP